MRHSARAVLLTALALVLSGCQVGVPPPPPAAAPPEPVPAAGSRIGAPLMAPAPAPDKWVLSWEDHFDGLGPIDSNKWEALQWLRGNNPNGPDGWWKWEDAYLDGEGHLILRVKKIPNANDDQDPFDYSEGAIRSKGRFAQRFGRYEARCTLPAHPGWWAAFWLMPAVEQKADGSARDGSEIDIMEAFGANDYINHALHWDGYGPEHKSEAHRVLHPGIKEGFHTFALEWYENLYIFYVDGTETWQSTAGGVSQVPAYVKLTTELETVDWATHTNWAGNPELGTFPDYFVVDYVKVYTFRDPADAVYTGTSWAIERDQRLLNKPLLKIPHTPRPITVTGQAAEWEGVPETPLALAAGQTARMQFAWDDAYLHVRADVADDMPMVNPNQDADIWKGDNVEITLSTDPLADVRRVTFAASDFQIGLSPGDAAAGVKPSAWIWTLNSAPADAKIFSTKTEKGYLVEAAIPWKALNGFMPTAGLTLGFNFAMDDADDAQGRKSQAVWFGEDSFYRNPSVWGSMQLVP